MQHSENMERNKKAQAKASTFAIRTSQRTDQKLQKSFPLSDPKNEFQNIFPTLLKKIKHPYAQTNTKKKNDTEAQQRQWFTDTVDKNASTQQAFGSMAGSVVKSRFYLASNFVVC